MLFISLNVSTENIRCQVEINKVIPLEKQIKKNILISKHIEIRK